MGNFIFKDLLVWQKAVEFAGKIINLTENLNTSKKHYRLIDQIEAATLSVSSNIAEGKGRHSKKEFIQYLYISRGSLYECVSVLHVFYISGWIKKTDLDSLENNAEEIAKMLNGLIKSIR